MRKGNGLDYLRTFLGGKSKKRSKRRKTLKRRKTSKRYK